MEVPPYVSFGVSPDLSVSVSKRTFDISFIGFTLLWGFFLIAIIFITALIAYNKSKNPKLNLPVVRPKKASDWGAVNAPGFIIDSCTGPFYGPNCDREKHDRNYLSAGNVYSITKNNIISSNYASAKSFSDGSCSKQCDGKKDCIGFYYQNNNCILLKDLDIKPEDNISYDFNVEPNLYIKDTNKIFFSDRIFLASYPFSFPLRFWLVNKTDHFQQIQPNRVYTLDFFPRVARLANDFTGIYSPIPFNMSVINNGPPSQSYIHYPGTELSIPPIWQYQPLYVLYY